MQSLLEILSNVFNSLFPVFGIMLAGMFIRKINFVSDEFVSRLNRLIFYVPMPCLLFIKIAQADYSGVSFGKTLLVLLAGMAAAVGCGYVAGRVFKIGAKRTATIVQASFRGNLIYVGLAVYIFSYGQQSADLAMITIAPVIIIYNVAAVFVLLGARHFGDSGVYRRMVKGVVTNPLIIGCVGGLVFQFFKLPVPYFAARTMTTLGEFALPGALLCVGGALVTIELKGEFFEAALSAAVKTVICPLTGLVLGLVLGLGVAEMRIVLIFLATPTAVASHVVSQQLGGDSHLAAAAVAMSTFFSVVSLSLVVAFV